MNDRSEDYDSISIVIPIYNEIHTIDIVLLKAIEALPEISKELVLVDDGSTDGTRQWLVDTFGDPSNGPISINLLPDHRIFTSTLPNANSDLAPLPTSNSVAVF